MALRNGVPSPEPYAHLCRTPNPNAPNSDINTRLHSEIGGRSFFSTPYTCALKGAEWCENFRLWWSSLVFLSLPRPGSTPIGFHNAAKRLANSSVSLDRKSTRLNSSH